MGQQDDVGGRVPRGRVYEAARAAGLAVAGPVLFSRGSGHWRSALQRRSVGADGSPIPWYSYPLVDLLGQRSFEGIRVLEFGGGASTLWWAARAGSVLTIEPNAQWHAELVADAPANVEVVHVPVDDVSRDVTGIRAALDGRGDFDLVVVDGHLREECSTLAWPRVAPGGALIFDNSESYGFDELSRHPGAQRVDFYGYSAGGARKQCSSVLFRDRCFLFGTAAPITRLG